MEKRCERRREAERGAPTSSHGTPSPALGLKGLPGEGHCRPWGPWQKPCSQWHKVFPGQGTEAGRWGKKCPRLSLSSPSPVLPVWSQLGEEAGGAGCRGELPGVQRADRCGGLQLETSLHNNQLSYSQQILFSVNFRKCYFGEPWEIVQL